MSYQLVDAGDFRKLEQIGPWLIDRPSPQAVWRPALSSDRWHQADARFDRQAGGEGAWQVINPRLPEEWPVQVAGLDFLIKRTGFGHLGIFPEQWKNWQRLQEMSRLRTGSGAPCRVLNLFGYTGGATQAVARGGAEVVHVDASKASVAWARENFRHAGLEGLPVRWTVDDARKFVQREIRRGQRYQGLILDPPGFGRGNKGEVWKIEDDLLPLLDGLRQLLAPDFLWVMLSSHSPGYTPAALVNLLQGLGLPGYCESEEMLLTGGKEGPVLPSGAGAILLAKEPP